MNGYTIGQLAKVVGVATSTIRFYERTGLFKPDARTRGNYRFYGEEALERLRFIRAAQATGFSLEDVRQLLSLMHSEAPPCEDVLALTKNRLVQVRQRIKELRHVEKVLAGSLAECCNGKSPDLCSEIVRLKDPRGRACNQVKKPRRGLDLAL